MDTETRQAFSELTEHLQAFSSDVDRQFQHMRGQFQQVDKRFEQVDARFERVDQRFEQMDKRFDAMDDRFDSLSFVMNVRFDEVDKKFDAVNGRVDHLYEHVDGFINLHRKVDTEFAAFRASHERLEGRVTKLEEKG